MGHPGGVSGRPPALPGYEVVGELGRGGMGVVWAGVERRSGRPVAIKVVSEFLATDPETRLRFGREVNALRGLLHPNVVQLLDAQTDGSFQCLVLERLDGGSLADLLRRGPVAPERAAALVAGAARGVHAAHELGLIHRDLKPGNVLLTAEGTPKVADFGLVRRVDSRSLTATGVAVGTPEAMAPEQIVGEALDARVDVWALGVLLYQLLVGRGPWGAATTATPALFEAILHAPIAPPSHAARGLSEPIDAPLDAIVLGCLERDLGQRTPSALALALALEGWVAARSGRGARGWREARRRRRLAQTLAGAALLSCGALVLAVTRAPSGPAPSAAEPAPIRTAPPAPPPPVVEPSSSPRPAEEVSPERAELRRQVRLLAEAADTEAALHVISAAGVDVKTDRLLSLSLAFAHLRRAERLALAGLPAEADADQAVAIAQAADEISVESLLLVGRARLLAGEPEMAAGSFQVAMRRDPSAGRHPDVLPAVTAAGVTTFDVDALADRSFFQVAVVPPEGRSYVVDGCEYFARLTPAAEARSAVEAELFARALVGLARLSAALGDAPRAVGALDRAAQEAPGSPLGWLARAEWRLAHGEVDAAASDLSAARPLVRREEQPREAAILGVLMGLVASARSALRGDLPAALERARQLSATSLLEGAPSGLAAAADELEVRLRRLPPGARPDGRTLFGPRPGGRDRPPPFTEGRRPPPPPGLPAVATLPPGHPLTEVRELLWERRPEAFLVLERALAGGPDPVADEAGLNVAVYACMAGCADLVGRSFFAPREAAHLELERRRAVVERVATAASPRSALGIILHGLLARLREAAGDHAGAREALRAIATPGGGDPKLSAIQLFELELAAGALDDAARAVEQLRRLPEVPAELPDTLDVIVAALRRGDDAAALGQAVLPLRELLRAYPGFVDPTLLSWLEARRRGVPFVAPQVPPAPPPLAELPAGHPLAEVRRLLMARRASEAVPVLERALAAGSGPLAEPAGLDVATTTILASFTDLATRSYFERRPAPDELARRRALLEQVAAATDPKSGAGAELLGLLARVRAAAGDHAGVREALSRAAAAPGLDGELARVQLYEAELAAGELDAAARAAEALRAPSTGLPPEAPAALLGLVDALRERALDVALARGREIDRAWPGLVDSLLVPWLEAKRR
jgi:hypothetical protein